MSRSDEPLPIFLVPGLLCDAGLWEHPRRHLGKLAQVHVADVSHAGSIAEMARQLLEAAPARFALAGLSMGGYVALEVMRQAPGRVAQLALLNTHARADTPEQSGRRRRLIALAQEGRFDTVVKSLLPMMVHPERMDDAALLESIIAMKHRVGPETFRRQQEAIIHRPDGRASLSAIACPTLVLAGRSDEIAPLPLMEELAESIPRARLAVIEDCGHMSTMERPQAATALLRDWYLYGR